MTNSAMIPNRFGRWAENREKLAFIRKSQSAGYTVFLCNYASAIQLRPTTEIRATRTGLWVRHGKKFFDYSLCAIKCAK